ncbi:MAG: heme ABC exporter ATP-binding protein CcmA [Parvibaculum sp.]
MTTSDKFELGHAAHAYAPLALHVRGLACVRGERPVFSQVDFDLAPGEMLTLKGPNGAGKSSFIRQVAGLLEVSGGEIELEGAGEGDTIGDHALYAGHLDAVKASLSVFENMAFWADFYGVARTLIVPALECFALSHLSLLPAAVLSAGQKRRLGLARLALIPRPIWLLDEPTVSLDAISAARLADLMRTHLKQGGLILAATHVDLGVGSRELHLGEVAS